MRIPSEKDNDSLFQDFYTSAYYMTIISLFADTNNHYSMHVKLSYRSKVCSTWKMEKNMGKKYVNVVGITTTLFCNEKNKNNING